MISKNRRKQYDPQRCIVFSQTKAPFGELSNMCAGFQIKVNGELIRTAEALYQACRYPHLPNVQEDILAERSPMTAKMVSRRHAKESREDWDKIRIEVMRWCLKVKVLQHWDVLREIFTKTDGKLIVEKSRKDDFWGAKETKKKTLRGANVLGQLLMEVRDRVASSDNVPTVVLPPHIPNFLLLGKPIDIIRKTSPETETRDAKREQSKSMNTVYAFGAGASLHAGYPLASKMGEGLLDFMLGYPINTYRESAQLIIDSFGKCPNVEDLITEIEAKIESLKKAEEFDRVTRSVWAQALGNLGHMLREWFRIIHNKPASLYADFADRIVKQKDTVITFNYDDSLDRELKRAGKWDLSCGYGFPLGKGDTPSDVLMLKLHGSINWMISIFGGARGFTQVQPGNSLGGHPVIHTEDAKYLGYTEFHGHTYPGGGVSMRSLILPGRRKRFFIDTSLGREFEGFWNALWSQGADALKKTDRLVICGYSMPEADKRARELLLGETPKKNHVTIISGGDGERIANDFRAAGFQNVEAFKGGYFEQWLQSL